MATKLQNEISFIHSKMLLALTNDTNILKEKTISLNDQKKYIKRHINNLGKEDKIKVCNFIIEFGCESALSECNDGITILFKKIPDEIVRIVYDFCKFKMEYK